jgi:hypothetical protein
MVMKWQHGCEIQDGGGGLCANNSFLHDVLHQYLKFC